MANPMATFRQHQRAMLAIFSVALILVFTVGSIVSQYLDTSRARSVTNDVVVQMASGAITEGEIQAMRTTRRALLEFMKAVNLTAYQKGAPGKQSFGIPNEDNEVSLVRTAIMAKRASDLGLRVSDQAIIDFLKRYSDGTLETGEFATILHRTSGGRLSQTQFMDAMRREMLALRFMDVFQRGLFPATPGATWDYFQRLNRRVSFEAVPFEAADYLNRVEEPSDQQVQELYEQGKNRSPRPEVSEPGFKRLKKVSVQYVRGDLENFLAAAEATITEEQIKADYEANRESLYRNISLPPSGGPATTPPAGSPAAQTPAAESSSTDLPAAPSESVPSESSSLESSGQPGEDAATSDSPASDPATSTQPLQDDPTDDGPKVNSAPEGTPAADAADAETDANAEAATVADAEPAVQEESAETPAANADASANENATEESSAASETPAEGDAATENEAGTEESADDVLGNLPDAPGGNAPSTTYKSLDEVRDEIRTRLAAPIARQQLEVALGRVRNEMRAYGTKYSTWEIQNETVAEDQRPAPPAPPDLRAIAAEQGLSVSEIPLVNIYQLIETDPVTEKPVYDIAFSYDMNGVRFFQHILAPSLRRYDVQSILGYVRDVEFLYWKTDDQPERIPELSEVRSEVVRALKLKQALQLAKDDAAAAAKALQEKGERPSEAYRTDANRRVINADSITWMTPSIAGVQPPEPSRIPGIQYPGQEFMKTVFNLEPKQAASVVDQPQDTAYAVYVTSVDMDNEQLRQQFIQSGPTIDTVQIAVMENRSALDNWYRQLEKELQVEWKRDPMLGGDRN